jgi:hypothetical protein
MKAKMIPNKELFHHIGGLECLQKLRYIKKILTNAKEQERTKEDVQLFQAPYQNIQNQIRKIT